MLSMDQVLKYVKTRMSMPSSFLEKSDDELKDYIEMVTIPAFSQYFPDEEHTGIDASCDKYKHPIQKNHFLMFDDEGLDIYGIKDMFFENNDVMFGGPIFNPYSLEGMKHWALQVFKADMVRPYSDWGFTYRFYEPNVIRILPDGYTGKAAINYEREQPHDLRKIPPSLKIDFMNLALADCMIMIGQIRTMYNQISTPFGEIPLNGQELKSDGERMREETIRRLEEASIPAIVMDIC